VAFPHILDSSYATKKLVFDGYNNRSQAVPLSYIIDREGKVVDAWYGYEKGHKRAILSAALPPVEPNEVSLGSRPRARITTGKTSKFRMGCGTLFVTVNKDDKGICEVFDNLGKADGCPSQSEATCRVVSTALRSGVDPKVIIDQLSGIRCLSTAVARKANKGVDVLSCPDAIAQALEEALGLSDTSQNHPFVKKWPHFSGAEKHTDIQVTSCRQNVSTTVDFAYIESE